MEWTRELKERYPKGLNESQVQYEERVYWSEVERRRQIGREKTLDKL